jgi:GNAT superfamily N-acetyltransferase
MRAIVVRTAVRPGDVDAIVRLHGSIYSREFGFDSTFEHYVAAPLAAFVERIAPRERIWIAEHGDRIVGSVAIVAGSEDIAQLRWFLVEPGSRGDGLGTALLRDAVAFCRDAGYASVVLWTVNALTAASRLYVAAGFRRSEEKPGRRWGVDVVEEKYEMALREA